MNYRVVAIVYLSLFLLGISDNIRGPVYPEMIRAFSIDQVQGALFFSIASIVSFLTSLLSRFWIDQINRKTFLNLALLSMGFGILFVGLAPNYFLVLVGCAFFGAGFGGLGVAQNLIISQITTVKNRQKIMSGLHSMYALASVLSPLLMEFCYKIGLNWKAPFLFIAGMIAVILLISHFSIPLESLKSYKITSDEQSPTPAVRAIELFFASMMALYVVSELLVSTRLPYFLRTHFQLSQEVANLNTALFFVFLLIGRLFFTFVQSPFKMQNLLKASLIVSILFYILGFYVHPFFLSLLGLSQAPFYPIAMSYAAQIFPRTMSSAVSFCLSMSAIFVVIMHTLFGYISEIGGVLPAMHLGPLAAFISVVMLTLLPKIVKKYEK